jgi:predicted  nucleic acid-binding Zn-ribbon protein
MAIDEVPVQPVVVQQNQSKGTGAALIVAFLVIAGLAVGEFVTIHKMNAMRSELTAEQAQLRDDINGQLRDQVSNRLAAMELQNNQNLDAVKAELDDAAKRVGAQGGELRRARKMVADLQNEERSQTDQLKQQIDTKADEQQVGALTQDVSSTKTDLKSTQGTVDTLTSDLGMARSQMGTLIARNHDDIEYLRKLGDRDYFEFKLIKNQQAKVAGIGLTLKRTNLKRYQYTLDTLVDDMHMERKDCLVNSPIDFFVNGSRKPYELVINSVGSTEVKGYLSTPKGVTEVASRSEGGR